MDYLDEKYSDVNFDFNVKNQDITLDYGVEAINNSIENILLIDRYTVVGRPEFGCDLRSFLFDMMDDITISAIQMVVDEALREFEPRIVLKTVDVVKFVQAQTLLLGIEYSLVDRLNSDEDYYRTRIAVGD